MTKQHANSYGYHNSSTTREGCGNQNLQQSPEISQFISNLISNLLLHLKELEKQIKTKIHRRKAIVDSEHK